MYFVAITITFDISSIDDSFVNPFNPVSPHHSSYSLQSNPIPYSVCNPTGMLILIISNDLYLQWCVLVIIRIKIF